MLPELGRRNRRLSLPYLVFQKKTVRPTNFRVPEAAVRPIAPEAAPLFKDAICNGRQESQLMLTNPRDAFRGQSRSPNIVPFHVIYSFLLCNSNFVFIRYSTSKKSRLEIPVGGHSRSLKVVPFDRLRMISC